MKSHIGTIRSLAALFLVTLSTHAAYGQERPTLEIGILVDFIAEEQRPLLDQLQSEIRAVVGEDATLNFPPSRLLSNGFDAAMAEAHYQTLLSNDTDIIIAFGPVNNGVISGQASYPKPTILFGAVNLDLVELEKEPETSGIDNFNYLIASHSYRHDLETFKSLFDFHDIAVLVAEPLAETLPIRAALEEVLRDLDASLTLIPYSGTTALAPYLERVDAVYLAEGFSLTGAEIQALAQTLFDLEIPSFTSTSIRDVEFGLMGTHQSEGNITQFFRRIALNVESVVNGVNLSELPTYIELPDRLTINWNTAEKTGVPINLSYLATTDFVGDFRNVVAERTYSLPELIDEVLERNLGISASRKQVELAEQDLRTARSAYLPDVSAGATTSYVDDETARASNGTSPEFSAAGDLTATQTIFSESANANIDILEHQESAERENVRSAELDLVLDAANAYFNALIVKTSVQIQAENLEVTRENLRVAEQNFEAGQAGRADVLRFRSEMAQNMQVLIESIHQLEQAFFALNQLVNQPVDRELDVLDARISEGVFRRYGYEGFRALLDDTSQRSRLARFLTEEAKRNAPELRALDYNLEATQRSILLNGARFYLPTIAAQARYDRTLDQWGAGVPPELALRDTLSAAVSFSIPLFARNQRNIDRETSLVQKERLLLSQQDTRLAIERNVQGALLDVINQISNIELSKVSEEAARESLELVQVAYSSGAATLVEVLDAQNNYLQAQLARANAGYNYLLTSIILERFLGYFFLRHSEVENQAFVDRILASTGTNPE